MISIFVAEGAFRVLGDQASPEMKGLYMPFGDGAYKLLPNARTGANWASGSFTVTTDDLGMRCDSAHILACHGGETIDALVIGDSQGFGNGVNFASTIAGGAAEAAHASGLRIANASVGGHLAKNQFELIQWLEHEQGLKVANYILLLTPSMTVSCDGYTRAIVGEDGRIYDKPKSQRERSLIFLKSNSVAYPRVRNAIRNLGIGIQASSSAKFIFRVYGYGLNEQKVQKELKDYLARFDEFARRNGARVWLVYVPLTVEVEFDSVLQAAKSQGISLDRDLPFRTCATVAGELGLPLRSLRPVLEGVRADVGELHLKGDYHYNADASKACGLDLWHWLAPALKSRDIREESFNNAAKL